MTFSRRYLLEMLDKNGISPSDEDFRARIEQYILFKFDLLAEELVDKKGFRAICSLIASKVSKWYTEEADYHLDRLFDNHKVTKDEHTLHNAQGLKITKKVSFNIARVKRATFTFRVDKS